MDKVNILGQEYEIVRQSESENPKMVKVMNELDIL